MQEMGGRAMGITHVAWNDVPGRPSAQHTGKKPGRDREGTEPGDAAAGSEPRAPLAGPPGHGESQVQRTDRMYAELLQEVRLAQAGIQILFGSLLYLGVTPAFSGSTSSQRVLYCISLLSAIGAAGTLLAPAAMHRFMRGHLVKRWLVTSAHRHLMCGLAFIALAISSALTLILDMAFGTAAAAVGGSGALAWFLLLWVLTPLQARSHARTTKTEATAAVAPPGRHHNSPPAMPAQVRTDLAALRGQYSKLRRRTVGMVLGGYLSYAMLSCLAPSLTGPHVLGNITLGMVLGLGQIGIAPAIQALYAQRAGHVIDPLADHIRIRVTGRRATAGRKP